MSISTRLSRAAIAFIVFGIFAAMLPSNGSVLADTAACPPQSNNNNLPGAAQVVLGVGAAGLVYAVLAGPSRRHHSDTTTTSSAGVKQVASNYAGIQGYLYNSH
jgi:hypothetical protein